ncbi:thiamine pyrophosphate-dependent enzyme [Salirhabdus salicampi]|uniref:thiamine pyrophosphate-dependent enzyme n=1 Tax=Salirhabdus salicampi TaxID=476102 RepID=UPI00266D6371|nr:thiamine pyrophosphate-dependent enzyme [Salirhabdus salicampi]
MTGAQAIVSCMKREGVKKVFCVPGESYLPLLDAIYEEPNIDLISNRHEGGAAFMAEGYAKASGKPGVVMATRGVGAANLSIGVHTAHQDSTPMVILLGQVHRKFRYREGFQEIDLDRYFSTFAKWAIEIQDAERVPELIQRGFRIAQSGRPGPVVLSLPEDMLIESADMTFGQPYHQSKPRPSQQEIHESLRLFRNAKRPLLIAGGGVKLSKAEHLLIKVAEHFRIPVMAAFRRHDVFPNQHPNYVGHLGLGTSRSIIDTVDQSDLIVALGTRLSEVTTQDYSIIQPNKPIVHIDIDEQCLGKVFSPHLGIVADAGEWLSALLEHNIQTKWEQWITQCRNRFLQTVLLPEQKDINTHVIHILSTYLPRDAILTNDAGNFAGWLHKFYLFKEKNTYIGPTSGAMGYGMPAAVGAKMAQPLKTVVSLSGDGGFFMTIQELETAIRYDIPIICIVFNNQMYGTIRMHQEIHYPKRVIGTELGTIHFANMAESIGAVGVQVNDKEQFESALRQAFTNDKPTVIEVNSDPSQISVTKTIE